MADRQQQQSHRWADCCGRLEAAGHFAQLLSSLLPPRKIDHSYITSHPYLNLMIGSLSLSFYALS